ncbi:hypothetical protein EST38_g7576, partial [Candolleomyces aberdarensis]
MRIYSSGPEYSNFDRARAASALVALEEGIREYIVYGNGQKFKPVKASSTDTLPRPFVETIDENKGVYEHQWLGRLNIIIQGAKLHTCRASYHFSSSGTKNCYLADTPKKYEEKTQATRDFARTTSENFVKVVGKLLMRLDPGGKILFDYFGSGVPVKAKDVASDIRTFSVPAQHPSKLEAKTAAILEAAKAGLVELLRYPAETEPPEGYVSYWDTLSKHESYDVDSSDRDTDDEDPGKTKAMKKKLKRKRKAEKKKADKQASGVPVAANAAPDEVTSEKQTVTTTQVESEDESGEISDSPPPVQVQEKQPQRPQKKKRK